MAEMLALFVSVSRLLLKPVHDTLSGEKMSEFYLVVGVLIRRAKISSPRGIFVTFPRPKFQISSIFPDQIYDLVTSTRLNCPNELFSFTSSKKDLVIRRLKH